MLTGSLPFRHPIEAVLMRDIETGAVDWALLERVLGLGWGSASGGTDVAVTATATGVSSSSSCEDSKGVGEGGEGNEQTGQSSGVEHEEEREDWESLPFAARKQILRLVRGCLEKDTRRRWSIARVLRSPWFEGLSTDDEED